MGLLDDFLTLGEHTKYFVFLLVLLVPTIPVLGLTVYPIIIEPVFSFISGVFQIVTGVPNDINYKNLVVLFFLVAVLMFYGWLGSKFK